MKGVGDMQGNDFEAAFDRFLEQTEYDAAEAALFSLVRAAFLAGWRAAGGSAGTSARLFEVLRPEPPNQTP